MSTQQPQVLDLDGPSSAMSDVYEAPQSAVPPVVVEPDATAPVVDEDAGLSGGLPPQARVNADGSVTLPLRAPIVIEIRSAQRGIRSETFAELIFNRLVGADIRAINAASDDSRIVVMMAKSARVREAIMSALFDRMDGADVAAAGDVVNSFFGSGRKTGR